MGERGQIPTSNNIEGHQPQSETPAELPNEIRKIFENTGYGCLAAETNIGIVHICHAADNDIEDFVGKPVSYQWQLIEMPTAPLLRFVVSIHDQPQNPYRFESFLNIADEAQVNVLSQLAGQDGLYLAFYGDGLTHRYTKTLEHNEQYWQQLDELVTRANHYWNEIPPERRNFNQAKALFMANFI